MGLALGRGWFPGALLASFGSPLRLEAVDRTGLQGGDASWGVMGRGPQSHQESHQDWDPAEEQEEWGGRRGAHPGTAEEKARDGGMRRGSHHSLYGGGRGRGSGLQSRFKRNQGVRKPSRVRGDPGPGWASFHLCSLQAKLRAPSQAVLGSEKERVGVKDSFL